MIENIQETSVVIFILALLVIKVQNEYIEKNNEDIGDLWKGLAVFPLIISVVVFAVLTLVRIWSVTL